MSEILYPENLDQRIKAAIQFFWKTRKGQISRQTEGASRDQGNRGAATGGKQLDGFVNLVREILIQNGVSPKDIFCDTSLELPGFYRPNKKWDLLVITNSQLSIAIEFKSQVGPSFGNNFNNRTEEAMGSALDIWTAYREGVFGHQAAPWIGYLMVLEDCSRSTAPVAIRSPHFNVMPEFEESSYKKRYELFCNKLVLERQYNSTCFITTEKDESNSGKFQSPANNLSFDSFISSMIGSILANHAVRSK